MSYRTQKQMRDKLKGFGDANDSFSLDELTAHLSSTLKAEVKPQDIIESIYYSPMYFNWKFAEDNPVVFCGLAQTTDESIQRIEALLGKEIGKMSKDELASAAMRMFRMPLARYEELAKKKGIVLAEDRYEMEYKTDGVLLFGVLEKAFGIKTETRDITKKALKHSFGLGYVENLCRSRMRWNMDYDAKHKEGLEHIREHFQSSFAEHKDLSEQLKEYDGKLTAAHEIAPPVKVSEIKTGKLLPLGIAFTDNDHLVVLGQRYKKANDAERETTLSMYDPSGKEVASAPTGLPAAFDGCAISISNFQGSVSVGSNGLIYVGGLNSIAAFDRNLKEIVDPHLVDADSTLKEADIINWSNGIFQCTEADGVYYFALQPDHFPKCYGNILVACGKDGIIGEPIHYSPTGGYEGSEFNTTPRFVVHEDHVYFKSDHNIVAVHKSFAKNVPVATIVDENDLESSCVPSNHDVDPKGRVWAVTKLADEPLESIKCYRGRHKGKIVTHFYQDDYPGGYATMRSMAISKSGRLAYTDTDKNKIVLYQIEDCKK